MSVYRKKPVEIEAIQFIFGYGNSELPTTPQQIIRTFGEDPIIIEADGFYIDTLEGRMSVGNGDWIIKGVKGEFYPCKPDIFEMTYEFVSK